MNLEERIEQLEKQKEILKTSIRNFQKNRSLDTMDEVGYRELQEKNKKLQERIDELDNSLSIALEVNESHQRYNGKLQTRLTEVEEDNKKLAKQVEDQVDRFRKSGGL